MQALRSLGTGLLVLFAQAALAAEPAMIPPADREPMLRLDTGGPTSQVTALAFGADGRTLYAGGFDKLVHVWTLDTDSGEFRRGREPFRVPVGAGLDGAINAVAVSPDGRWLAVGGLGVTRGGAGVRDPGIVYEQVGALTEAMRRDQGVIFLFDTRTRSARVLRGHTGPVKALAFAPAQRGKPALLVSAASEWDEGRNRFVGAVRLWDVDGGTAVALARGLGGDGQRRPGLAAWHTGAGVRDVSVAVAWDDGCFRVWDLAAGKVIGKQCAWYNNAVAYVPGRDVVLAGGATGDGGRLQVWDVPPGKAPALNEEREARFPSRGKVHAFPRALALLPPRAGGDVETVAVVLRIPARPEEYRLQLIDIRPDSFGEVRADLRLWSGAAKLPALAAAPGGRYLAVAGNDANQVMVYSVPALLRNRDEADKDGDLAGTQRLQGRGTGVRTAAFVARGKQLGLLLGERGRGGVVFDFAGRRIAEPDDAWKPDAPNLDDWHVRAAAGRAGPVVVVRHGDEPERRIRLKEDHEVTAYALLPAGPVGGAPVLALGYLDELRQPMLGLWDVRTGEQVRQLSGHTTPVHALAFSADGRLLTSAAEDEVACVWSLTDLNQVIGRRGRLAGLAVKTVGERVVVVRPGAAEELKEGMEVAGIVERGKLRRLTSSRALYDAVSRVEPGRKVTLRVSGPGDAEARDVEFVAGQGVDERKPLMSLFVTDGKGEARDWIGWSPNGPYDVSRPSAERELGWHFNTGKPTGPATFADASQYRKEYRREGILRYLAERGDLAQALDDWERAQAPPPEPRMSLRIDELGRNPARVDGRLLVRKPDVTLKLSLDVPPERVDTVRWRLDGGPPRHFTGKAGADWSADLSGVAWARGPHKLQVTLRTREPQARDYTDYLAVHYQPAAPVVEFDPGWLKKHFGDGPPRRLLVRDPRFTIEAAVKPADAGQAVKATLVHDGKRVPLEGLVVRQELRLRPGTNRIEIDAVNEGALRGQEALESALRTLLVEYVEPEVPVAPPQISLEGLRPAGAADVTLEPGQRARVGVRKIRLRGRVTATENLAEATLTVPGRPPRPLAGFQPGSAKAFAIDEELTLAPGSQSLTVAAKTAKSPAARVPLEVEFRPPVPRAVVAAPPRGLTLGRGKDAAEVELKVRLDMPPDDFPFRSTVLLNDRPLDVPVAVDAKAGLLTTRLRLVPGDNQVRVRLQNDWDETTAETLVHYLRPPRVVGLEQPKVGDKPLVTVVGRIETPTDLPLTGVDLVVRPERTGAEYRREVPVAGLRAVQKDKEATVWELTADNVSLEKGRNAIRIECRNPDGRTASEAVEVEFKPPPAPKPPPAVSILKPQRDLTVEERQYEVQLLVRSASPLRGVELRQGGKVVYQAAGADVTRSGEVFELKAARAIDLAPGPNPFELVAVNDGGRADAHVTITYVAKPVELAIDGIETREEGGDRIKPRADADGFSFEKVSGGRAWLVGHVTWLDEKDPQLAQALRVRCWVNGFQQVPTALAPAAGGRRDFRIPVLLNRARDNRLDLELPELKVQEGDRRKAVTVQECDRPIGQRLHLLVIGIGVPDKKGLVARALKAVGAKPDAQRPNRFTADAFAEGYIYGPLTDYVTPADVLDELQFIKKSIEARTSAEELADVVMVYYQGGESCGKDGHYFRTDESQHYPVLKYSGIACARLANFFADTPVAQVLLLDVARDGGAPAGADGDMIAHWPDDSHVGVLRTAWTGKGPAPVDTRLITVLQEQMRQAARLKELANGVQKAYKESSEKYPAMVQFDQRVPQDLAGLKIGK